MPDLMKSALMFEVSSRLESVSTWFTKVSRGENPDALGDDSLSWTGNLMGQMDWNLSNPTSGDRDNGLAVQIASTRPIFYSAIIKCAPEFKRVGIDSEEKIMDFLKETYRFLSSKRRNQEKMRSEYLKLASMLFHFLSQSLMVQLSGNGVHKEYMPLKFKVAT